MKLITILMLVCAIGSIGGVEMGQISLLRGITQMAVFICLTCVSFKLEQYMHRKKKTRRIRK